MTTPTDMMNRSYHYTECGLDNVYLVNGYHFVDGEVVIKDIEGLHKSLGNMLVTSKANLSGKEIRFLRHEMSMSQATLAHLLRVSEQAVARWEKGKTEVPKPAETIIRALYQQCIDDKPIADIRNQLKRLADLEHEKDRLSEDVRMKKGQKWHPESLEAA